MLDKKAKKGLKSLPKPELWIYIFLGSLQLFQATCLRELESAMVDNDV